MAKYREMCAGFTVVNELTNWVMGRPSLLQNSMINIVARRRYLRVGNYTVNDELATTQLITSW